MGNRHGMLAVGDVVGPYRLDAVLGEGGMGQVFRAVHEDGTVVALKVIRTELLGDSALDHRFMHEARAAASVDHRHVVGVVDAGEADGRRYLAMRFIEGHSLHDRLEREGPLPLEDLVSITSGVAAGIDALHAAGLVHRDLKPANIMLDESGSAFVTDFGLSKGSDFTRLTVTGQVLGTLDYLAPELFQGELPGAPADIYALGCIVFECLCGLPPFGSRSVAEVGRCHVEEPPPDPCEKRSDAPEGFSDVVLSALAKDPAERPPTATAYARLLHAAARRGAPGS